MGFRSDFYTYLLKEVKEFTLDLPDKSRIPFLAAQMGEHKNFSPGSGVALLREADDRYAAGTVSDKEYFVSILDIMLRKKIRIQEAMFNKILAMRDMFSYAGGESYDKIHPELTDREYRLFYRRTEEIRASMEDVPEDEDPGRRYALKELSDAVMKEALVAEAKAWLYDAGFPVNNAAAARPRKTDHSMQLMDAFFDREGTAYFLDGYSEGKNSSDPENDRELIAEAEALFEIMDADPDYRCSAVPVMIDRETGSGLYIYGMESDDKSHPVYMKNDVIRRRAMSGHSCYYTIFEYCGSYRDTDRMRFPGAAPGRLTYRQYISNEGSRNESVGYINIEDALYDYKAVIRDRVPVMYEDNMPAPEGCPDRFKRYFYTDEYTDDIFESEADRSSYPEEERMNGKIDRERMNAKMFQIRY